MVALLLEYGADVNAQQGCGVTALHQACGSRLLSVARVLVEAGADVNARDMWGGTPLDSARDPATRALLLDHGARERGASEDDGQ